MNDLIEVTKSPVCPYCERPAELLASSASLYRGRDYGPAWACRPCAAWVGCHKGTTQPLGRLADAELRKAKMAAHAAFDPLWQRKLMKRGAGYRWLAGRLGIPDEQCHIGMFDVAMCRRVSGICTQHLADLAKSG